MPRIWQENLAKEFYKPKILILDTELFVEIVKVIFLLIIENYNEYILVRTYNYKK